MGVILDDLWDHEGYGARRLADGTHTGMWSVATANFEAYVASCGCGWEGGAHPPTEHGYESAVEEWEDDHARPLLARTVPDEVRSLIRDTEQSAVSRPMRLMLFMSCSSCCGCGSWREHALARRSGRQGVSRRSPEGPGEYQDRAPAREDTDPACGSGGVWPSAARQERARPPALAPDGRRGSLLPGKRMTTTRGRAERSGQCHRSVAHRQRAPSVGTGAPHWLRHSDWSRRAAWSRARRHVGRRRRGL